MSLKRKTTLLIGSALLMSVLTGCAVSPSEIDAGPVVSSFTQKGDVEDMYYLLTNPPPGSICQYIAGRELYAKQGEFKVYYGINGQNNNGFGGDKPFVGVYGKQAGDKVTVTFKDATLVQNSDFVPAVTSYLKTGRCTE